MHLLYLDDSGSVTNASDRHIVLAGLAVFERQPHWLSAKMDEIAAKVWPDDPALLEFRSSTWQADENIGEASRKKKGMQPFPTL